MREPILIGLSGKKGSGKSTVGEFMYEWALENGYKPEIRGFAWLLKLSFTRIFMPDATVDEAIRYCDWFKEVGYLATTPPAGDFELFTKFGAGSLTGRQVLQNYGTEAHRDVFGSDFWVDALLPITDSGYWSRGTGGFDDDSDFCIITDVRFPNEAERLASINGWVYEVKRPSLESDGDTHASEVPLPEDNIDGYIYNDSDFDSLRNQVFQVIENQTNPVFG